MIARLRDLSLPVWFIVAGMFLINAGAFLVIPIMAIYLKDRLHLSVVELGLVLAVKMWVQWGFAVVGGMMADRLGHRAIMATGLLLRAASYPLMLLATGFWTLLSVSFLLGLGSALYIPASKGALVHLAGQSERMVLFSLRDTAVNLGAAIGPAVGLLFSELSYEILFLVCAALFFAYGVLCVVLVPEIAVQGRGEPGARRGTRAELGALIRADVAALVLVMLGFFFFYSQIELTLPLFARAAYDEVGAFLLFSVNAATIIAFQVPVASRLSSSRGEVVLALGMAAVSLGLLLCAADLGLGAFLCGVFVFSFGEILIGPKVEAMLSERVRGALVGTAMGLLSLGAGIGGTLGHLGGGRLYAALDGRQSGRAYWLLGSLLALLLAFIIARCLPRALRQTSEAS
ncbi:MFS transporter [Sorangium sp. So ce260]|uniref:MFS transporter n=1 Tax=Sorangium sp. So ce260 TaxID=3133291 RepID=UPI003F5FBD9C